MGKQKGGNCGCSSGGLLSGGSGYSVNVNSSPMLLGPQSGYGAVDPYKGGVTTGSGFGSTLAYPPLTKFIGGQRRKSSRRSKSKTKSKSKSNSKSNSRKTRGGKSKRGGKAKSKKQQKKSSRSKSKSKSRGQKGGELSFSDFVSSGSAASVGQIASSPTYGANLSHLSPELSALAIPIRPEVKNTCN
jgi:hypothetical protein